MSIYLDYNATTPLRSEAKSAMLEVMDTYGNASSVHKYGREVRTCVELARKIIADAFLVSPDQVIFTSGATESNNTIIQCFDGPLVVSAIEHDSVMQPRSDAIVCPVDESGVVKLAELSNILATLKSPALVSIMYANNETGVMQPVNEIAELVKSHGGKFHCDAVQALGKLDVSGLMKLADVVSVSAHKIGGPQGVGAIIFNKSFPMKSLMRGGGQERRWRGGTENVIGAAGFGAALNTAQLEPLADVELLRNQLEREVLEHNPAVKIFGVKSKRLPNTSNILMPGVKSETQVMNFDLAGIAVSAGAACSSGKVQASHVLIAMGLDPLEHQCSLRVSMGWQTTAADVNSFIAEWKNIYKRCHQADYRSIL